MLFYYLVNLSIASETQSIKLFHIERNKNKNQVHYNLKINKSCSIVSDRPIEGFWIRVENGSNDREEFNMLDKIAYGIAEQKHDGPWVYFTLKALENIKIKAKAQQIDKMCHAFAYTEISGNLSQLKKVYVFAKEGFILPTVKYVDMYGQLPNGKAVKERITIK